MEDRYSTRLHRQGPVVSWRPSRLQGHPGLRRPEYPFPPESGAAGERQRLADLLLQIVGILQLILADAAELKQFLHGQARIARQIAPGVAVVAHPDKIRPIFSNPCMALLIVPLLLTPVPARRSS